MLTQRNKIKHKEILSVMLYLVKTLISSYKLKLNLRLYIPGFKSNISEAEEEKFDPSP